MKSKHLTIVVFGVFYSQLCPKGIGQPDFVLDGRANQGVHFSRIHYMGDHGMRRIVYLVLLALAATPSAWCAKKITVTELQDMLKSMQQANKSDDAVANELKQVELTEQLMRAPMNALAAYVPGKLTTEQLYVLEARSAMLPPPSSEIPNTAAPDAAAQKAMLDKAETYVAKVYGQLPSLSATKTTLRFQDNVEAVASSSGMAGGATDMSVGSASVNAFQFVHYINSTDTAVTSEHGIETLPKDKTPWGSNRMIALEAPDPGLNEVFTEAHNAGTIRWLRWELVNGRSTAVYSFEVPKKITHLAVNVCCFPTVNQAGRAFFSSATMPGGGGATGNLQTSAEWKNYKVVAPYHGELFVNPETGIVVRLITQAELKPSEIVRREDTRIDYEPVQLGSEILVLPVRTVVNTEVVPSGESGASRYSIRCTLFTSEYKEYHRTSEAKN